MAMMTVVKRDGSRETVSFDKILNRLTNLGENLRHVGFVELAQKLISMLYDGIETTLLDLHAADTCATLIAKHPSYGELGARLLVSNCHKQTPALFSECVAALAANTDAGGRVVPLLSAEVLAVVERHGAYIDSMICDDRDYNFDYFGYKTLERSYLLRARSAGATGAGSKATSARVVERPQYMYMRVAIGIHGDDLDRVIETYGLLSTQTYTHATPTLFNAGKSNPSLSSCFLVETKEDSIKGIYETLGDCANISRNAGGIGLSIHNVRASGSVIRGSNGESSGIVPMLRVFDASSAWVDQGGKRKGSITVFLAPWHADVMAWLDMRKTHGAAELRAPNLFQGLWIPDLFMRRVVEDGQWSLMCPDECPGLSDAHGAEFEILYNMYEEQGRFRERIAARKVWTAVIRAQIETGGPFMCYSDQVNAKNNQANLGVIKSSNLCTEIMEYSSETEVAVCNLASLCLPRFVEKAEEGKTAFFDFERLHRVAKVVVFNLDRVVDATAYPLPEARRSNLRHRPVGLGVQGLADVFAMMRLPFDSPEAADLNKAIFETIYHAAVESSCDIARRRAELIAEGHAAQAQNDQDKVAVIRGLLRLDTDEFDAGYILRQELHHGGKYRGAYSSFMGSPAQLGKLQFDLWGVEPKMYDWAALKSAIAEHGMRHSLLVALMPTASTSQIAGFNECFEPFTSNLYTRSTNAGNFLMYNPHLVRHLEEAGLWTQDVRDQIVLHRGSVQDIPQIPADIKALYKTAFELSQRVLIDMAADRSPFVCQSQSLNLFQRNPTINTISNMHIYAHERKLKTGMYYLHVPPKMHAQAFTVAPELQQLQQAAAKTAMPAAAKTAKPAAADPDDAELRAATHEALLACKSRTECEMCSA